jgi:hypothetical protein
LEAESRTEVIDSFQAMLLPQLELELVNAIGLAAVEFSLFLYDEDA